MINTQNHMIKLTQNTFNFKDQTIRRVDMRTKRQRRMIKTAAHQDILKFLDTIQPEPGKTRFHILFLGSGEFYSSNKNGDWFGEKDLIDRHKTFEDFGHVFRHHVNKDPKKKYGDILFVIYNPVMHRVEGIISLDNDKNEDVLEKYDNGENIPVSMAAKLQFDQCLAGNTEIWTADGIKKIKDIEKHDCVLTHTGRFQQVTDLFKRETDEYFKVKIAGLPDLVEITGNHEIWSTKANNISHNGFIAKPQWIECNKLEAGDYVWHINLKENCVEYPALFSPIESIEKISKIIDVYNFSVENDESYIANGIIVHNCSICDKRSKTIDEYCDHLKYEMNNIYEDGRKVFARNPNPIFFDISLVWRPADPTAYFFDKVASQKYQSSAYWGQQLFGNHSLIKSSSLIEKKAIIKKLAEIEKHVESILTGKEDGGELKPLLNVKHHVHDFPHSALKQLKCLPIDNVLSSLTKLKIMLTLKEFLELFDKSDMIDSVSKSMPGIFSKLLDEKNNDILDFDFRLNGGYLPIMDIIKKFAKDRILNKNFFNGKTISVDFSSPTKTRITTGPNSLGISRSSSGGRIAIKTANVCNNENYVADNLAKLYNLYKVAFCKENSNKASLLYSVLSNF